MGVRRLDLPHVAAPPTALFMTPGTCLFIWYPILLPLGAIKLSPIIITLPCFTAFPATTVAAALAPEVVPPATSAFPNIRGLTGDVPPSPLKIDQRVVHRVPAPSAG